MEAEGEKRTFYEVDRRYVELKWLLNAGTLSDDEFAAGLKDLMVLDEDGRWWAKSPKSGAWHYHDGEKWVQGTPPGYEPNHQL